MRNFELPGRSLAIGRKGMAATSHPMSTLVAVEILKAGGNAMDAAVAACAMQCVVEAGSTGIGGDCFALYAPKGSLDPVAYNGSGRTPAAATFDHYARSGLSEIERRSPHAVTVPGAVEAWARLVADHGRMSLAELFAPAIAAARDGYGVTPRVAYDIAAQRDLLMQDPNARQMFLLGDAAPPVGSVQRQPELADTLEAIGREGPDAFYRGAVAADMVDTLQALGGFHTLEDFASAAGEYVKPISLEYRGRTIYECAPNGQGIIALMILNILKRVEKNADPLDVDNLHLEIEATRLAYAARDMLLADMGVSRVPVDYLLSDELADRLAAKIDLGKAIADLPAFEEAAEHLDTVYIAVVDAERNAVSFINSLFHPYGTGLMAPKSGVLFHNRGQSFSLKAGHPNAIAPRKRPMHTIIPGMLMRDGRAVAPFGVMGGHYQAMGHVELLSGLLDRGLDVQEALDAPRSFAYGGVVEMESGFPDEVVAGMRARGHAAIPAPLPIGGGQIIWIDHARGTLVAGSDPRKDGSALGY
jgi:gamma-glutamyltranspeptidase / glutathione hydrolase